MFSKYKLVIWRFEGISYDRKLNDGWTNDIISVVKINIFSSFFISFRRYYDKLTHTHVKSKVTQRSTSESLRCLHTKRLIDYFYRLQYRKNGENVYIGMQYYFHNNLPFLRKLVMLTTINFECPLFALDLWKGALGSAFYQFLP